MPDPRSFVVVAYDISDDRRRHRVAETILGFGGRVQGSVYELWISPRDLETLWHRLSRVIAPQDLLRCYLLCDADVRRIRSVGMQSPEAPVAFVV
jgi:CRISPR-associated protein Cas2